MKKKEFSLIRAIWRRLLVTIIVILTVCAILLSFENLRKLGTGFCKKTILGHYLKQEQRF